MCTTSTYIYVVRDTRRYNITAVCVWCGVVCTDYCSTYLGVVSVLLKKRGEKKGKKWNKCIAVCETYVPSIPTSCTYLLIVSINGSILYSKLANYARTSTRDIIIFF